MINDALSACGFAEIEVSSFVSPRAIPQLRDADQVFAGIDRVPGTTYSALVPNLRELKPVLAAGVEKIVFFISASETHNRENMGRSIGETMVDIEAMLQLFPTSMPVLLSVSNVFGCPYKGKVFKEDVAWLLEKIIALGQPEIWPRKTWFSAWRKWVYRRGSPGSYCFELPICWRKMSIIWPVICCLFCRAANQLTAGVNIWN